MKKNHFYHFALLILLCLLMPLFASAQTSQPVIGYATIQGEKTGQFKGNGISEGNEGKIECIGFRYSVTVPHDAGSGKSSGKAQHSPFVIIKNIDYSTPQLLQSSYNNEVLKTVVIEFSKKSSTGQPTVFYRITLTNATISLISQYGGTASPDNGTQLNSTYPVEEVSLNFQKIEIENTIGNTSAADDWKN